MTPGGLRPDTRGITTLSLVPSKLLAKLLIFCLAHSSRFAVLTGYPSQTIRPYIPDNLAQHPVQHNFTTSTNVNTYDGYGYSGFTSPPLSLVIPPSKDAEQYDGFAHHPQTPTNTAEYGSPVSYASSEYTQYREYLASSRSTAQQQQLTRPTNTDAIGPIRRDVWRVKSRLYRPKVAAAETASLRSALGVTPEERKRALRLQFRAQYGTASPISPKPSPLSSQQNNSTVPYLVDNAQPLPNSESHNPLLPDTTDRNTYYSVSSPSPSTLDGTKYPHGSSRTWTEHAPISNLAGTGSPSSSSSENLATSRAIPAVHLSTTSTTPVTSNPVGTVFIHSNLTQLPESSTTGSQDYPEYIHFFPLQTENHRRLRVAMHYVMTSEWKLRNELEPTSRHILQFSARIPNDGTKDGEEAGLFSYRCLLYHGGKTCDRTWARAERMLAHLRGAIDLRPFACEGAGGGW